MEITLERCKNRTDTITYPLDFQYNSIYEINLYNNKVI